MRSQSAAVEPEAETCPASHEIQSHLQRVLGSAAFASAPRLSRFLAFVVETTLAGNSEHIKESLIAIEVYGRRPDYNPQIDSTVRVEAGRLRARLRQYYESGGESDGVEIELPKGTYVPVFRVRRSVPVCEAVPVSAVANPGARIRLSWRHMALAAGAAGCCAAVFAWSGTGQGDRAHIDSIAVLPLMNLSDDGVTDRFCDALTEEITTLLARDGRLRVAAGTTMARYKNAAADVGRIGRDHRVTGVLEGSVRRDGNRLVVTTQLTDTRNGYHVWADRFERNSADAAGTQGEFASNIVSRLRASVQRQDGGPERQPDSKTMELYHRAQDLLRIPVLKNGPPEKLPESVLQALGLFREVTVRSPRFGKGWAGLAEAAEWEYELRGNQPRDRLLEAKAAAQRAVALEPDLVEGWTILTSILFYREWDFPGAEAACRRVIELDPRNTSARQRYANILRVQGRRNEARSEIGKAIRLQPATAILRVRRAAMLYEDREYDQALIEARAAAELTNQMPAYSMALWLQGICLEQKGQFSEAERMLRLGLSHQPHDPFIEPSLAHLLAKTGRTAEAEVILAELRSQLMRGRLTHAAQAIVHVGLGRKEEALHALERGWAERDDTVLAAAFDPRLQSLQSDIRFRTLAARLMKSPEYAASAGQRTGTRL